MSGINKTGNCGRHASALQKLFDEIAATPEQWILFLGNDALVKKSDDRRKILSRLANQACNAAPASAMAEKIRRAVQENNFANLSTALFGCAWDGATFLDGDRERNVRLREQYAKELPGRDEINVYEENGDQYLWKLIGRFRGIILTTCQDDTVEAFWEYENSLPADTIVHTPQLIAGSNDWSRWLHTAEETPLPRFQNELPPDKVILVKLFGSREQHEKMLLSQQDLNDFYPMVCQDGDWGSINTILFLGTVHIRASTIRAK